MVTLPASGLWPVAGMGSVLVTSQTVQVNVFTALGLATRRGGLNARVPCVTRGGDGHFLRRVAQRAGVDDLAVHGAGGRRLHAIIEGMGDGVDGDGLFHGLTADVADAFLLAHGGAGGLFDQLPRGHGVARGGDGLAALGLIAAGAFHHGGGAVGGAGGGHFRRHFHAEIVIERGDVLGLRLAADGACKGLHARRRAGGRGGFNARVPGVFVGGGGWVRSSSRRRRCRCRSSRLQPRRWGAVVSTPASQVCSPVAGMDSVFVSLPHMMHV